MFESQADLDAISAATLKSVTSGWDLFQEFQGDIVVQAKETPRDVVTPLDHRIEAIMLEMLKPTGLRTIGEETWAGDRPAPGERFWCIDPIDGTLNAVNGLPFYGSSVGLVRRTPDDEVTWLGGGVYLPAVRELFFTLGNAAYLNGKRLALSSVKMNNALIGVTLPSRFSSEDTRRDYFEVIGSLNEKTGGVLRLGSAAATVCQVAAGRLGGACGYRLKLWDVAGALAVASSAGYRAACWMEWDTLRISFCIGSEEVFPQLKREFERLMK